MGKIKDDERRLLAAVGESPDAPVDLLALGLGIDGSRAKYLARKLGRRLRRGGEWEKGRRGDSNRLVSLSPPLPLSPSIFDFNEPQPSLHGSDEEIDGELQGQEWADLDDRVGRADDPPDSD